jgi:hypothetical protein
MKRRIVSLAIGIAMPFFAAQAHHSISGYYDTGKQVTFEGNVAEFQFVNPHPYVTIEVKSTSGEAQRLRFEMDNLSELIDVGMTRESLKPGDQVIVKGNPAHDKPQSLYLRRLDRPGDGFWYDQVDRSPRVGKAR